MESAEFECVIICDPSIPSSTHALRGIRRQLLLPDDNEQSHKMGISVSTLRRNAFLRADGRGTVGVL